MLKEFVDAIAGMATKAMKPELIDKLTNDRRATYAMPNGNIVSQPRTLPNRGCMVTSLREMAALNQVFSEEMDPRREIFIDADGAVMLIATDGGFDRVMCHFERSESWKALIGMNTGVASYDQKTLLRHGRFVLRMTPGELDPFRKLDFSATQTATGDVRKTSESLGRTIASSVASGTPIPDTIDLSVPIYTTPGEDQLYTVTIDVEISTADQRILLKPLPGELDRCLARHLDGARERMVKLMGNEAVPVYLGMCWK